MNKQESPRITLKCAACGSIVEGRDIVVIELGNNLRSAIHAYCGGAIEVKNSRNQRQEKLYGR